MYRIDYIETFTLITRQESLRIFLAIATILGIIILQIDVINAYLERSLKQYNHPIYMRIPQDCTIGQEGLVYKIFKSLYGLKQARRLWNKTLIKFFQKIGFVTTNIDPYILVY